jgi:diguanylate cyclase (GGDEF)-like protein/PAS domain S-box-containing protein
MQGVASLIASAFDSRRIFENAQLSNNYMQAILESAKDLAVISTDLHGYILTASMGALAMFKLSQQEILGKDILTLFSDTRFQRELAQHISSRTTGTLERNKIPQCAGGEPSYLDVTLQGVYDQAKKPIGFLCVVRDGTQNVLLQKSLEALSVTDELTRLYNTRRFFSALSAELERHKRFHRKLTLCFFDLDGFKEYNDAHGHPKGDVAIRETAELLLHSVRSNVDSCYRYGGDEFTIIMPETAVVRARGVIERIRARLEEHFQGHITASIGMAESSESMGASELVEMADRAMYAAKAQGGNRVVEAGSAAAEQAAQGGK